MEWLQQSVQNDLNLTFNGTTNKLGPRQLVHFGVFTKLKTGKDLLGFLFNDFFMLVQPSKTVVGQFTFQKNSNITYKMYKQVWKMSLPCQTTSLEEFFFFISQF